MKNISFGGFQGMLQTENETIIKEKKMIVINVQIIQQQHIFQQIYCYNN